MKKQNQKGAVAVEQIGLRIESDISSGNFDDTLVRYRGEKVRRSQYRAVYKYRSHWLQWWG
jgi:hypothetical protein